MKRHQTDGFTTKQDHGVCLLPVDVAAVTDAYHLDDEPIIEHLVDDAVVADPHAVGARFADEGDAPRRAWGVGKEIDRRPHSLLLPARQ